MAKVYIGSPKYIIKGEFEVDCVVEKPDVIGAVFGQSEGLLGEEMDFKELQQAGKIGRIEVNLEIKMGKTLGSLTLSSSMDKVQTSLIAATIESVDKIGPGKAHFTISEIVDNRKDKRQAIEDRAKQLLSRLSKDSVDQGELENKLRKDVKAKNIVKLNGLDAGPDVKKSDEVIIVEGRADVVNLLKYGINNAVALNGSNVPPEIEKVVKGKKTILLVDGDRGGKLIAKKVYSMLGVDYIASAPEGMEVEELPGKILLGILKKKIPSSDYFRNDRRSYSRNSSDDRGYSRRSDSGSRGYSSGGRGYSNRSSSRDSGYSRHGYSNDSRSSGGYSSGGRSSNHRDDYQSRGYDRRGSSRDRGYSSRREYEPREEHPLVAELKKMEGSFKSVFLDKDGKKLAEVALRETIKKMEEIKDIETLMMDGIITARVVKEAEKYGIKTIVGIKTTARDYRGIKIISAGYQRN